MEDTTQATDDVLDQFAFSDDRISNEKIVLFTPDDDMPETLWSEHKTILAPVLFVGIVLGSALLVAIILYCSRGQERRKRSKQEDKKVERMQEIKKQLVTKPWAPDAEDYAETVASSVSVRSAGVLSNSSFHSDATPSRSRCESGDSNIDEEEDLERGDDADADMDVDIPNPPAAGHLCKDGSVCVLCQEEYQPGQPVYESNNPHCGHEFHIKCMDQWLACQNSCPICNQPFSIQTV